MQNAHRMRGRASRRAAARRGAAHGRRMISVEGVEKAFQIKGKPIVAVQDVSCVIEQGSFVTLVGPSGCGKSTLLQMIAGLIHPTRGRITFKGSKVTDPPFDMV